MDKYNFIMIGRRVDDERYVGQLVWIKGTIQVEEKDKDSIVKLLKERIEKALKLTHPCFKWRDVSLMEQGNNVPKGIHVEDIELWEWYNEWDEPIGFKEKNISDYVEMLNLKLLMLQCPNK